MANMLTVPPSTHLFRSDDLTGFRKLLATIDEGTVRWPINAPQDLELDDNGRLVSNGFSLSYLAYTQVCNHVASGLWRLTSDISGDARRKGAVDQVISTPLAAQIFNKCVGLRFRIADGVCGKEMIQNHVTSVVDGVVGPRYRYLSHCQLLDSVVAAVAAGDVPMSFHGGELIGRRVSMTFLADKPFAVTASDDVFVGGCYFANSEAGECGVLGALLLQPQDSSLRCLANVRHISHAGKSFARRLGSLLSGVLGGWPAVAAAVLESSQHLCKPLDLTTSKGLSKGKRRRIVSKLGKYCDQSMADDVARHAIFAGAAGVLDTSTPLRELAARTSNDVFVSLMRIASQQYPDIRECLERAAFDILANRLQLSGK